MLNLLTSILLWINSSVLGSWAGTANTRAGNEYLYSSRNPAQEYGITEAPLRWPVRNHIKFVRGFLPKLKRPHYGLDLAAPVGTEVYSASNGRVRYVGFDKAGYGRFIVIEDSHGWSTYYAHLSKIKVPYNSEVKAGQVIGLMGMTGNAEGPHLHFETRRNNYYHDPMTVLPYGTYYAHKLGLWKSSTRFTN